MEESPDSGDGSFVGRAGLRRVMVGGGREVELAYALCAERWNRGFATEMGGAVFDVAFGTLGLTDLVCLTLPENQASRRVMEKLGFRFEREIEHAGMPHVLTRLPREAWESSRGQAVFRR